MGSRYVPPQRREGNRAVSCCKQDRPSAPRQDFNTETGQVYDEVEVVFKKKQNSDWIGELKTPSIVKKCRPAGSGARSLFDMAKSKCVTEFRHFTPHHFETIPWSVASTIWDLLTNNHRESFHAWRTLATVYNRENEFGNADHRYHLEIKQPPLSVQEYFRGITSPEVHWLAALRVSPKQISIPDLVAVAYITNLALLDLSDGQLLLDATPPRLDERIVRTWAELASAGRAFKNLRVLMLGWQDNISNWIFKYFEHFPTLQLVILTDCKSMHQKNRTEWEPSATAHGWTAQHAKRSAKILRPLLDDPKFHTAAISNIYYQMSQRDDSIASSKQRFAHERLPVIECWLGTPRRWTHILDEFPGTRTIWFEKGLDQHIQPYARTSTSTPEAETTKRVRETTLRSQVPSSPPRKKSQSGRDVRMKAPLKTAASLLADMNT